MNFKPPVSARPDQPPIPQQPPVEGADPAAVIAARTAAVARNRRESERAAFLRDVMRIAFVAVLIGGASWIVYIKHRNAMAEERERTERARMEQAARAEEAQRRAEEQEKAHKARLAAAAEKREYEEKLRRAKERKEEEARIRKSNVERYRSALDRFKGASLGMLSTAPDSDIPAKVAVETWFSCIVAGGHAGTTLYEVKALPGKDIHVYLLEVNGRKEEIPLDDFNRSVAKSPYLLAKGARCYYRHVGKGTWELREPIPARGDVINPARVDFRDLYEAVRRHGVNTSEFYYEVFFRDVGGAETRIHVVPFGGMFGLEHVLKGLKAASAGNPKAEAPGAFQKRLNEGSLVIRRKGASR